MIKVSHYGTPVIFANDNSYNQPSVSGAVQWNGLMKRLEVSNGTSWVPVDNTVTFTTSGDMEDIISWAKKKMTEERELENLAKSNPIVADLLNQIKDAQHKVDMVKVLIK